MRPTPKPSLPPRNMSKPILVEFDEIQQKSVTSLRAVLVLDVSGSMKAHKRLEILKDALDSFLLNLLDDFIMLAIVTFSTVAKVQHPMTAVNLQTVQGFRDAVKDMSLDAQTCIGCGLRRAIEVLNTSSETPEGAIIVVFTDGEENKQPYIHDVWPQLLASKVEVVTMAMGDKAEEKLEKLAAETKGQSYFFPDRVENTLRTYIEGVNSQAHEFTYHPPIWKFEENGNRSEEDELRAGGTGAGGKKTKEIKCFVENVRWSSSGEAMVQEGRVRRSGRPLRSLLLQPSDQGVPARARCAGLFRGQIRALLSGSKVIV
ncbi:hypothetical protein HPB49_010210 [Dermacentor silvarum]|uniref:Uncharacterized protein n=1 Tax=Dermacentor silvarum TaxID=543639 RepID=A0ACB8DN88_DERSI|nr:hypothetical protein HPB49_010210 [Dermacentor silvarum]